jgi:hypothetical protein
MSTKVSIKKDKVIKALEATLKSKNNHKAEYDKAKKDYDKAEEAWQKKVRRLIKPSTKITAIRVHWNNNEVALDYAVKVPEALVNERPESPDRIPDYQIRSEVEEITSIIKMLEMAEDTVISASAYKNLAKYL